MHQLLQLQTTFQSASGHPCMVENFLGGGGQGEVYQARLDGRPVALKWYFPEHANPVQWRNLRMLIRKGAPSAHFLWPLELTTADDITGFGYIMPLRESRYKGLVDLMKRRVEPSFRTLALIGTQLAQAFLELHAQGLCYRDISFGNVFFDADSGEILICDNDNVAIDGESDGGVLGTPRFIAPEVVRGETVPNTQTDLFSLAVLLFYLFHLHHPLEGAKEAAIKCFDLPAMNRLYGTEPVFIFDPKDTSNRPQRGTHDNALDHWPLYPQFFKARFIRAFGDGLRDPQARVRESEWRAMLLQLHDTIFYCGHCGAENFYDQEANAPQPVCWACQQPLQLPFRLYLNRHVIMLNHDTQLFPHHLDPQRPYDLSQAWAVIRQHPSNPNIWGLNNSSPHPWTLTASDGQERTVEPGRSVSLADGIRIDFGLISGTVSTRTDGQGV
jgi:serine/threonine protein kinase